MCYQTLAIPLGGACRLARDHNINSEIVLTSRQQLVDQMSIRSAAFGVVLQQRKPYRHLATLLPIIVQCSYIVIDYT